MSDERNPVDTPFSPSGDVQSDVVSYVRASPALDDVPIVRDRSSLSDAPDFSGPESAWPDPDEGRAERQRSEPRGLGTAISQRVALFNGVELPEHPDATPPPPPDFTEPDNA
jgi:hypothetical protein